MKSALFSLVSNINLLVFKIIQIIGEALCVVNGKIGWLVLNFIDKERLQHAELSNEQEEEILELSILTGIHEIRRDAMKSGKWNEDHQDGLNFLGNALANQHDWEVEDVERYIHEVIATGPVIKED